MPKIIIHVNQHIIRANRKNKMNDPPITVRRGKAITRAHRVRVLGPSEFVYAPNKPLPCGARLWSWTESEVLEFVDK